MGITVKKVGAAITLAAASIAAAALVAPATASAGTGVSGVGKTIEADAEIFGYEMPDWETCQALADHYQANGIRANCWYEEDGTVLLILAN